MIKQKHIPVYQITKHQILEPKQNTKSTCMYEETVLKTQTRNGGENQENSNSKQKPHYFHRSKILTYPAQILKKKQIPDSTAGASSKIRVPQNF